MTEFENIGSSKILCKCNFETHSRLIANYHALSIIINYHELSFTLNMFKIFMTIDDSISVSRGRDPFGQHQKSRPLTAADFLSMHRVVVLFSQPIRFARFDKESVNRGL